MVETVSDQLAVAIMHARLFKQVQNQAMTDSLTSLYNHGAFKERLDREIKLAERNGDRVSLILLDLDHLKRINDTYGHRAGDECLIHVSEVMRLTVRDVDICARYGGEEFVVILPQCSREDAIGVAERLRERILSGELPEGEQLRQEAIAAETVRVIAAFKETGKVPNVVNLADRTPATHLLVVRHHDRPGVLAYVLNEIKAADINVQQMENIVFAGAEAAVARIELDGALEQATVNSIRAGNNDIIEISLIPLLS